MKTIKRVQLITLVAGCLGVLPSLVLPQPLAKGQAKFLGSSMSTIFSNFGTYFNQVTPENAGKWGSVEGSQGAYSWSTLDGIYSYAISNYFPFKDHNLVWGQQQPGWITGLDSAGQRAAVEKWIDTVGQRYPSMSMIDVVNEPLHASPPYLNALGGSGTTGWDWVVTAFQWARKYCFPGVKLLINDYNILGSNSATTSYIDIIDTLKVRGLIDGIGIQCHYFEFKGTGYSYPISTLQSNLNRIAAVGLPIYISEFDIDEADDSTQLANYKTYFPLLWENSAVKGITLWGYVQGTTWKPNAYLVRTDGSERSALQWLRIYVATPKVVSPVGQSGQPRDVTLTWHSVAPATSYHVQIASDSLFSTVVADTSVIDTTVHMVPLAADSTFYWHVSAVDAMGESASSTASGFTTNDQVLNVEKPGEMPTAFELLQNYPNPFNPVTQIRFTMAHVDHVRLEVYNLLGQKVATLMDGFQRAGMHEISFDASQLTSGIYLCQLRTSNYFATKKLVLLK